MVVRRGLLDTFLASAESLIRESTDIVFNRVLSDHFFVSRKSAEYDFSLKQVIPYVIIRCGNHFLLLRRTAGQTEERLHNKYSLGIGGHINPPPPGDTEQNIIIRGLYKELGEEIRLSGPGALTFVGIINDESSSVSKVHLGLFYVLEVESEGFAIIEADKMVGDWVDEKGLVLVYDRMETWSQIVFDQYVRKSQKVKSIEPN